jgi:hypothetical protein
MENAKEGGRNMWELSEKVNIYINLGSQRERELTNNFLKLTNDIKSEI